MSEEQKNNQPAEKSPTPAPTPAKTSATAPAGDRPRGRNDRGGNDRGGKGRGGKGRGHGNDSRRPGGRPAIPAESDYEEKNLEVSRVTRVTKGGKRMRFRVLSVIGNHQGRVGYGLAKGLDVAAATGKATTKARKSLITVPLVNETIPFAVQVKAGAALVLLKPAPKGTGIKAGGPVRVVLELAGIPNITAKILGTNNKISNVRAVFNALLKLEAPIKADEPAKPVEETPAK